MRLWPANGHSRPRLNLNEYLDGLYSYAMVLSRNHAEAEDLVQETCLRALRSIGGLRADSKLKGWLFTILRNIWLNQLRQWRTGPAMVEIDGDGRDSPVDAAKDPHAVYVSKIEREQVRASIQQLPLEFREIILLREYEELTYQEIATLLNLPLGTVMSRLARARSKLRDLLPAALVEHQSTRNASDESSEGAA